MLRTACVFWVTLMLSTSVVLAAADGEYITDCSNPLATKDGKSCGMWGCVANPDGSGTFCTKSPKGFYEGRTEKKRGLTNVTAESFDKDIADVAKSNNALLTALKNAKMDCCFADAANCAKLIEKYGFTVYLLTFPDGSAQYLSPFEVTPTTFEDRDAKEVHLFTGDYLHNLQPKKEVRTVYLSKGSLKYVSGDGTVYPVQTIQKPEDRDEPFSINNRGRGAMCSLQMKNFTDVIMDSKSSGQPSVNQKSIR